MAYSFEWFSDIPAWFFNHDKVLLRYRIGSVERFEWVDTSKLTKPPDGFMWLRCYGTFTKPH